MIVSIRKCKTCGSNTHHTLLSISEKKKTATFLCSPCKSEMEYTLSDAELKFYDMKGDEDES